MKEVTSNVRCQRELIARGHEILFTSIGVAAISYSGSRRAESFPPDCSVEKMEPRISKRSSVTDVRQRSYRDLLFFQERMKQNMLRFKRTRGKWQIGLYILLSFTLYCLYSVYWHDVPPYSLLGLLVGSTIALGLYTSGMIHRKLWNSQKFVNQCNKSLKPFNMSFENGELKFNRKISKEFQQDFEQYKQLYFSKRRKL